MIAELTDTKICSRCEDEYPRTREYFYGNSKTRDGLGIYCRKCQREIVRTGYKRRMEHLRASPDEYRKYRESVNRRERRYRRDNPQAYTAARLRFKANRLARKMKLIKR